MEETKCVEDAKDAGNLLEAANLSLTKTEDLSVLPVMPSSSPSKESRCPDCGSPIIHSEGCQHCSNPACGWGLCG
jgi:hypothetical protein